MTPTFQLLALCGIAAGLIVAAVWIVQKAVEGTPEKRERKRRLAVNRHGRLGDALITDADETVLYYSYSIRGVQYTASQDVASLRELLPAETNRLVGVAGMKYATNNPANSILLCEEWSGLRGLANRALVNGDGVRHQLQDAPVEERLNGELA